MKKMMLAFSLVLAVPAAAQAEPSYVRALAAGYKASFLCSDIFNAGMTEAQVEADDLKRNYPEYVPIMAGLEAKVDRQARTVSVTFDDKLPPRIAVWRPHLGCAQLPIGAAVQQGIIDVNAPAPVPEWQSAGDPRQAITTDHLLRMASGLYSATAGNRTDATYFGGSTVTEDATPLPLETAPGTRFRYANNDTLLAIRGLKAKLGTERALSFPLTDLFWRIGMTRTVPETDWQGNFILSSQVWTTARDLARLGLLYVDDGVWNGERILPLGWGAYVSRRGPAQPGAGYGSGATFWTFPADLGMPSDAYIAQGNRGQYLVIVPSRRIVIVRRGYDGPGTGFDPGRFTADVLAALR